MTNHPVSLSAHTRKGAWKVTARTISGHSYHYHMETERDADLLAIALQAHSRDIAETQVHLLSTHPTP